MCLHAEVLTARGNRAAGSLKQGLHCLQWLCNGWVHCTAFPACVDVCKHSRTQQSEFPPHNGTSRVPLQTRARVLLSTGRSSCPCTSLRSVLRFRTSNRLHAVVCIGKHKERSDNDGIRAL